MPRVKVHHHPCADCGAKTECPGTWEENYDGFPQVICREWHRDDGGTNPDFTCEGCEWKREDAAKKAAEEERRADDDYFHFGSRYPGQ